MASIWPRFSLVILTAAFFFPANASACNRAIQLAVTRPDGKPFTFGKIAEVEFALWNASKEILVIASLKPLSNAAEESIVLTSSVYGSIEKQEDADRYRLRSMSQRSTQWPLHGGLLFPGEKVSVVARYRPVAKVEQFWIDYYSLGKSAKERRIYLPNPPLDISPDKEFIPFTAERWQEMSSQHPRVRPLGPGISPRAVLIPELQGKSKTQLVCVRMKFEGCPFTLDQAQCRASKISGTRNEKVLAYSSALGGYVVFEEDGSWILASTDQTDRGRAYAPFPPVLLKDLDVRGEVRIRVGDGQKGFGPDVQKSQRKFWDCYPVYYGDGMYTRGEFLHLKKEEFADFLAAARQRQARLQVHGYFFRSRYYVLETKETKNAQPGEHHGS